HSTWRSHPLTVCYNSQPPPCTHALSLHDALPIFALGLGQIERRTVGLADHRDRVDHERGQQEHEVPVVLLRGDDPRGGHGPGVEDRKSTRLNSSHVKISYAVFCLKKKNPVELYAG